VTLHDTNPVYDRLTLLAACLCAQIQDPENGVPDVCFCGIVPGEAIPVEYAGDCNDKCGIAWVRMTSLYPSNMVGVAAVEPGNCGFGLGADVEIGILRCISVGDQQEGPTPTELVEAAQLAVADALLIQKAVYCCEGVLTRDVVLGLYTAIGPEGGLIGGAYNLSLGV
jgi:hypothetical protein